MAEDGGVNRVHASSVVQKAAFLGLHLVIIALCAWLGLGWGIEAVGSWLGEDIRLPDATRSSILLICAVIYFIRHVTTLFYLLARRVDWREVFGVFFYRSI
jgi:hypothetical protein